MQYIPGIGLDELLARLTGRRPAGEESPTDEPFAIPDELASSSHADHFRALARLGLQVASGLAHAHVRGVVHRDIKPANLLLDPAGVVWITDFGLAKHVDENLTQPGDILGTLCYMAPERFQGVGDARSDIYALGATLYELVTRKKAFPDVKDPTQIEALSAEPPRPRQIEPRVPRDLETIVLEAMQKDPARRYATAAEFADDLRRFLDDEPIRARPIGVLGRAVRWGRRRPALASLIAAVAVLTIAIVVGAVASAIAFRKQAIAEGQLREDADEARDTATEQTKLAVDANLASQDIATFMLGILDETDPLAVSGRVFGGTGGGRTEHLKPAQILERALVKLDSAKEIGPKVRAALLDKIGTIYASLGQPDRARPLLEKALELRRAEFGDDSLEAAATLHNLGYLHLTRKNMAEAEDNSRRALEIRERLLGPEHPLVTVTLTQLAIVKGFDTPGESFPLLQRARANLRKHSDTESREYAMVVALLTVVLFNEDRISEAALLLPEALRLVRKHEGNGPLALAMQKHMDGRIARTLGMKDRAAKRFAEAVEIVEKAFGEGHFLVILGRTHLAAHYHEQLEDLAAAEAQYRIAVRSSEKAMGVRSIQTANTKMFLARVLRDRKQYPEAEKLLREASDVMRIRNHSSLGRSLHLLWEVCYLQGKYREGFPSIQEAVRERKRGGDLVWYSNAASNLADECVRFGRREEAAEVFREAIRHLSRQETRSAEVSWALAWRCAELCQLLAGMGGRNAEIDEVAGIAANALRECAKVRKMPVRELARRAEVAALKDHPAFRPLLAEGK